MGLNPMIETSGKINFQFLPFKQDQNLHAVERVQKGAKAGKRRYLIGVSSGLAVDGHGERMTEKAIDGFLAQANTGEVLLYPDVHGIKSSDDIGRLVKSDILDDGDWQTEFELYDGSEGAQNYQVEKANALWNQVMGLPPYKKARQKGFSIEGSIPEGGFSMDGKGRRVINSVELDGVVVVPKPAYNTSIAMAIYKALGEKTPQDLKKSLSSKFSELVSRREEENEYYSTKWDFSYVLDEAIKEVMENGDIDEASRRQYLEQVFQDFTTGMIDLILRSVSLFSSDEKDDTVSLAKSLLDDGVPDKVKIFRALNEQLLKLHRSFKERTNGKKQS